MVSFFVLVMMFLSIVFLLSNTPHILIMGLLFSAVCSTLLIGMVKSFPWLSYILFMAFLGGVLILFTYVSSLSLNLLFVKPSVKQVIFIVLTLSISASALSFCFEISDLISLLMEQSNLNILTPKELFSPLTTFMYFYLFIYLLLTLVYIVAMMKIYKAPLRFMS